MKGTKHFFHLVIILFVLTIFCSGNETVNDEKSKGLAFSGYFENQAFIRDDKANGISLLDYNKVRLDLSADIADFVTFNADVIFYTYHGTTAFNILDFLPESIANQVPDYLKTAFMLNLEDDYFINDAYITFYLNGLMVRVGKQQIPWGTGYTWNPTDNLHNKNQLDPTYDKKGVNALMLEVPLGPDGAITAVAANKESVEDPSFAIKIKKNIAGFDISGSYQFIREPQLDPAAYDRAQQERNIIGLDFTGEIFDIGVWGEGTYNIPREGSFYEKKYAEFVLGMDYTFQNALYIMTEYLHRDQGADSEKNYTLIDFLKLIYGEITNISTDYIVCGGNYPLSDLLKIQLFTILNLQDGSWILVPWLVWDAAENTEIDISLNFFFGDEGTEYGEYPSGGLLRFRVYF